jgi:hypothetical protein
LNSGSGDDRILRAWWPIPRDEGAASFLIRCGGEEIVRMRRLLFATALLAAGLVPAAALAGGDDDDAVTVVSGARTELSRDGGATWRPAVVVSPYRLWAAPLAGSEWVSVSANRGLRPPGVGLRARYRHAFRLSDCGEGSLRLRLHIDNDARVFLNGTRIGSTPAGPLPANFQGAPLAFEADGPLRNGRNVLEFRASDQGIVTGLDFKAVVTCDDDDDGDDGDDDDGEDDGDDDDDEERDNG